MSNLNYNENGNKASEIIKEKLYESNGRVEVYSVTGQPYEIKACYDGKSFESKALPINFEYSVFDKMVECMEQNGGKARKGCGRNFKLGEDNCDDSTLVGYIGKHYIGKNEGESVYDPVFVLLAVLEWAGIAHNQRGYGELTEYFKAK